MTTEAMERVEQDGLVLVAQAEEIAVQDTASFHQAGMFLRNISAYLKKVGEVFDPVVESAFRAHKIAVEQRKKLLEPAEVASRIVRGEMTKYEQAERDRVAKAQAAAEKERRRLEDEERLKNATRLEAQGKPEAAAVALTAPVSVPVFTPPVQAVAQVEGVSFRDNWDFVIEDAALIPREYLIPDEKRIRGVVKAMKMETKIPGIRVTNDRISAVRA